MQTYLALQLIPHQVGTDLINQRAVDGYVNATAMCKAVGKQFFDYRRLGNTGEFLNELSAVTGIPVTGIPVTGLVIAVQGGRPELQGRIGPRHLTHDRNRVTARRPLAINGGIQRAQGGAHRGRRRVPYSRGGLSGVAEGNRRVGDEVHGWICSHM